MQESVTGLDAPALAATVAALQDANKAELASGDKRKTQVQHYASTILSACSGAPAWHVQAT